MPGLLISACINTEGNIHILFETALERERIRRGKRFWFVLPFSFEDLNSIHRTGEHAMHNCHRCPLLHPRLRSGVGVEDQAPAAPQWWHLGGRLSALLPWSSLKWLLKGAREKEMHQNHSAEGMWLGTAWEWTSQSLKCNTLMSGKFSSVPGEDRMVPTPQQSCPCTGRGFLSPGGCTLGVTVAASFASTLGI